MNLHSDKQLLADAIRATSETMGIAPEFVEKDYWICHILQSLSRHLHDLVENDQQVFDRPPLWREADLRTSPLITDFDTLWQKISPVYLKEVGALSYGEIPDKDIIAASMKGILNILRETF